MTISRLLLCNMAFACFRKTEEVTLSDQSRILPGRSE